jgi:hypothetical protein
MNLIALFLLAAIAEPAAAQDGASTQAEAKKERKICKRYEASETRMGSKRICRTAKEWREAESAEGGSEARRGRGRDGN